MNNTKTILTPTEMIDKTRSFPFVLHSMLEDAEQKGFSHIVSWLPCTDFYFKVHDRKAFTDEVMKTYFAQSHFKSFQRQLHLYCFKRNKKTGPYFGAYSHLLFVRGQSELCQFVHRVKNKNKPPNALLDTFAPLDPSIPSTRVHGSEQSPYNEFQGIDPFPGKALARMKVHREDTAGPKKEYLHDMATIQRDVKESKSIKASLRPLQHDPLLGVSSLESTSFPTPTNDRHELLLNNQNSFSSGFLYEPFPIKITGRKILNFTSPYSNMMLVKNEIIDIFGSR